MACRRAAAEVSVCAAAAIDATVRVDERPSHRNGTQGSEAAVLHERVRRAQNGPRMGGPGPTGEGGRSWAWRLFGGRGSGCPDPRRRGRTCQGAIPGGGARCAAGPRGEGCGSYAGTEVKAARFVGARCAWRFSVWPRVVIETIRRVLAKVNQS